MVTSDLGACEWFVWDLRRSGLIDRGQLDQIVGEFLKRNPRAEAPALAEYLVNQGTLTNFQAERILNGKTQGLVLGPYVLLDAIGTGSMGQVYKASSKNDSNLYAIKVLPRRSMWNVRLARRQVRSFGSFGHPAVVPFMDVGTAGGLHYLVWPLCEGTSLEAVVQQNGKLDYQLSALYAVQIAQGLAIAHQNNLFHGLLKPSNVMLGSDNQARILDFGIGSLLVENEGESLVDTMSTANTLTSGLDCAAPESIMEPTNRTPAGDQYSLGCTLYYCLTGRVPFPDGSAVEKMMAHQAKEPMPIQELAPEVPEGLSAVVAKLMAKTPEERYSACDDVIEALEPFLGDMQAALNAAQASAPMAAPAAARYGSKTGSNSRMPGIGASTSTKFTGFGSKPAMPASTVPTRGNTNPSNPSPGFGGWTPSPSPTPPPAMPMPTRSMGSRLPGRESFHPPASNTSDSEADLVQQQLYPAASDIPPALDQPSGGWVDDDSTNRSGGFGALGLIAAAMLLMTAVYFGATMLMKQ